MALTKQVLLRTHLRLSASKPLAPFAHPLALCGSWQRSKVQQLTHLTRFITSGAPSGIEPGSKRWQRSILTTEQTVQNKNINFYTLATSPQLLPGQRLG